MKDKMVSQPSHYADGEIECIDAMVAAFGSEKVKAYAELAAFKYQWRMDKKHEDSKQDKQAKQAFGQTAQDSFPEVLT